MSVNSMPKLFTYAIIFNDDEDGITYLTTDPKGWDGQEVSFSRTEDFGLNAEFTVPFYFAKEGRSLLKNIFDINGSFSNAKLRIYKRANNWALDNFYEYKLDFKTYKDDLEYIAIEGLETGLNAKIQVNADTEYEIDLPTNKDFLNYTAMTNTSQNVVQGLVGSMYHCGDFGGKRFNRPNGSRAVKAYSSTIGFVDGGGIPFTGMLFHNIAGSTITGLVVKTKIKCRVLMEYLIGYPPSGVFSLVKHTANFSSFTTIREVSPNSSQEFTADYFDTVEFTDTFDLASDWYVSLIYASQINGFYTHVPSMDGCDGTYIKVASAAAGLTGAKLCVVTYQWLITQLLLKVDANSSLVYNIVHTNIIPLLSCQQAIQNINQLVFAGKIKTSLKTALKSLNGLCGIGESTPKGGIGIDITGEIMTIDYLDKFYLKDVVPGDNLMATLNAVNVQTEFDEKHCYNKIKVGSNATNLVDNGLLAFNCENNFALPNATVDKELDLVNPYVLDMYSIDKLISDRQPSTTADTTMTTENDSKLVVFAGVSQGTNLRLCSIAGSGSIANPDVEFINKDLIGSRSPNTGTAPNLIFPSNTPAIFLFDDSVLFYIFPSLGTYKMVVDIDISFPGGVFLPTGIGFSVSHMSPNYITYKNTSKDVQTLTNTEYIRQLETEFDCKFEGNAMYFRFTLGDILGYATIPSIIITKLNVSLQLIGGVTYELYKTTGSIKAGFQGDVATAYNLPFSPKRILNSFKNYLAISNWKSGATIDFISTNINSTLESQLGYETAVVKESESLATVDADAVFMPISIIFDTDINFDNLNSLKTDKYRYYEVVEKGTSFKGWVNTAACHIGELQKQQWKLQAKSIEKWWPDPRMYAFVAPLDFNRKTEPVDIATAFQRYDNLDKKYAFGFKRSLANYVRLEGGESYFITGLSDGINRLITHFQTTYTGQNGGTANHYDVVSTDGAPDSGCVTWSDNGYNNILCFFYTSKTGTSFIGELQTMPTTTYGIQATIVGFDIRTFEFGCVIVNNSSASTDAIVVNTFAAYWAYIGNCTRVALGWNAGTGQLSNIKYVHHNGTIRLEHIEYGSIVNNSFTGICTIPSSVLLISYDYTPENAGYRCLWSPLITKINFNKELTHIGSGGIINCPNCTDYSFYSLAAPTVLGDVSAFMNNNTGILHIKPSATGYDVAPWTNTAIFSEIIEDL
jgi:hypothetical protein